LCTEQRFGSGSSCADAAHPRSHRMSIKYCVIARRTTVLAEYATEDGALDVTRVLLGNITTNADDKQSFKHGERDAYHYIVNDGITYMCKTDAAAKLRVAFAFLDDVKQLFKSVAAFADAAPHCD
jgi:vesicle-associated membrane protein 7